MPVKRDTTTDANTVLPDFTLSVVQELGSASYDSHGEHPPLRLIFMMISDHFAESARSSGSQYEYRINRPNTDNTITVTVNDPPER